MIAQNLVVRERLATLITQMTMISGVVIVKFGTRFEINATENAVVGPREVLAKPTAADGKIGDIRRVLEPFIGDIVSIIPG